MKILRKRFIQKRFDDDVTGFNFGVGLFAPPLMTAWCYELDGILIDTGITRMHREAMDIFSPLAPATILLTHHHEDHSGNAGPLSRRLGIPVFGHPYAARKLAHAYRIFPYQHLMWGKAFPARIAPFPQVIESRSGRYHLSSIHTPGHSKDHTVFYEASEGWLFSGDLFLGEKIKYFRADEQMAPQIASIRKILELDFHRLYCAHRPTMVGGKKALTQKLDYLENLSGEVLQLHGKGLTEKEIIAQLDTRDDRSIRWLTMDNVSFGHMVRAVLNGYK